MLSSGQISGFCGVVQPAVYPARLAEQCTNLVAAQQFVQTFWTRNAQLLAQLLHLHTLHLRTLLSHRPALRVALGLLARSASLPGLLLLLVVRPVPPAGRTARVPQSKQSGW